MHPLVKGAAAVAVLTALGGLDRGSPPPPAVVAPPSARGIDGLPALCGTGALPEGPVCLRILCLRIPLPGGPPRGEIGRRAGVASADESIPRRPDRSADPGRYRYPVEGQRVLGGFDVGVTPQGIRIAASPGERIKLIALERQEGPAEVVFASDSKGAAAIATYHLVREGERARAYLLILRGLAGLEPGLAAGALLEPGAPLGSAALHEPAEISLEARQMREAMTLEKQGPLDEKRLTDAAVGIPIDLRNVLPPL
jgi:hypothetical protein